MSRSSARGSWRGSLLTAAVSLGLWSGWANQSVAQAERQDEGQLQGAEESAETREQIEELLNEVGRSLLDEETGGVLRALDMRRMVDDAVERKVLKLGVDADPDAVAAEILGDLREISDLWMRFWSWDDSDVLDVRSTAPDEYTVVARHWDDGSEIYHRIRWRVTVAGGTARVFGFEDLDFGLRASDMIGIFRAARQDSASWLPALEEVYETYVGAGSDADGFDNYLDALENALDEELPEPLRAHLLIMLISAVDDGEADYQLERVEELEKLEGEYPMALVLRGHALTSLERHEEAIEAWTRYGESCGWYVDVCEWVSDGWMVLEKRDQALEFALRGVNDNPHSWGCLSSLAVALPEDRKAELDPFLEKIGNPEGVFESMIDWCLDWDDRPGAWHLYRLLREHHPDSDLIDYYREALGVEDF